MTGYLVKIVTWKEIQHDDDDSHAARDVGSIVTLRDCGLLNIFRTPSMVSHAHLLEYILRMWNPEQQYFEVGLHIVAVEDIYFLTGLSRRGEPISLIGSRGGDITTQELIVLHCYPGTKMLGKKIPIKDVMDLPLWTILFTMQRVAGSQGAHQASWEHILYALEAMAPIVFNWVKALFPMFKY